jgi:hypothetical protein
MQIGILILAAAVNLREWALPGISSLFGGIYTDLNSYFFEDVCALMTETMIINAFVPQISLASGYFMRLAFRMLDQRKCCPRSYFDSKSNTVFGFIEKNHGIEFPVHYWYAYIQYTIFITFMYGAIIPLLFPICLFSLASLWVCERLRMFYHYTKPPTIPEDLAREVLKTMFICVPFYLFVAMFAYSNKQVFYDSEVSPLEKDYVFPLYDHHIDIFSFEV